MYINSLFRVLRVSVYTTTLGTHKSIRMTRIKERAIARPNGSSYDIEKGTNGTADDAISSINRISVFAHDANPTSMYNVHGVLDSTAEFKHIARQTCLGSIGTALIKRLSCGLTEEVLFTEFAPYYFKRIRNAFHIKGNSISVYIYICVCTTVIQPYMLMIHLYIYIYVHVHVHMYL